ncbi:MAG: hypothetical protein DME41_01855 [Verrucomicrobia bacterium]|nr:MAG: hypothetical protein DME41_01855 [Verrucomicrobiota bacterium]
MTKVICIESAMKLSCCAIVALAIGLLGCETAHNVGRTLTAPVRYVFNEPERTPAANASDVTNPGQPVAARKSTQQSASAPSRAAGSNPSVKPSPSSQTSASTTQFPVAKPVPDRPGLVFNPFNAGGGYIDVSGYAPGSKVKDPTTQKIFIVP